MPRDQSSSPQNPFDVAVIGASAFGGWTALHLLRRGLRVALVDAWGPGNTRASSGGETRIIRSTYGPDRIYWSMVQRARELWEENQERWGVQVLHQTGALWIVPSGSNDAKTGCGWGVGHEEISIPIAQEFGVRHEALQLDDLRKRFPQMHFHDGIEWALHEEDAGFLLARRSCELVMRSFMAEGGDYRQLAAKPVPGTNGAMPPIECSDGSTISAGSYVFACGPWLGKLFPEEIGNLIKPRPQEAFYFGIPPGNEQLTEENLPVWAYRYEPVFGAPGYSIPGNQWRGLKVAVENLDPESDFDPTTSDRVAAPEKLEAARNLMELCLPSMKGAPLLESVVCQYESTPDNNFVIDRHPGADNVWFAGGGSGHGFKHGPAVGEMVSKLVLGETKPEPFFALKRFRQAG